MDQKFYLFLKVLTLISLMSRSYGQNDTICNPLANCKELDLAGIKIPDPNDCHNYYLCIEGLDENGNSVIKPTDQPLSCAEGENFHVDSDDQSLSDCKLENTSCINVCANRQCLSYCKEDLDVIAAPNNCSFYYFCVPDTVPVEVACTEELPYFNGIECSDNPFECCDICTPYCSKAFTEVPDPKDCTNYYLCTEDNSVPTEVFDCGTNENFNPATGFCEANGSEPCESLC